MRNNTRPAWSTTRPSLCLLLRRFSHEGCEIPSSRAPRPPTCPRTSPAALAFLQDGFHPSPAWDCRARHLPESLGELPGAEPNESGAGLLEEVSRNLRLVAAEGDDLGDRLPALRHDDFLARLDARQVLAEARLQLRHGRGFHERTPVVNCRWPL